MIKAIESAGLNPPNEIIADGRFHRFDDNGSGNSHGFYTLHESDSGLYFGSYGTWGGGGSGAHPFSIEDVRSLSTEEKIALDKVKTETMEKLAAEKERMNKEAADKARHIGLELDWKTVDHPYLDLKGVKSHGTAISRRTGKLVVPIFDLDTDELCNLQFISADGKTKRPLRGGKKGYFHIGTIHNSDTVFIVEGFATGASVFEATDKPVVIAFDSGQLSIVGEKIRDKVGPDTKIEFVADNDHLKQDTGKIKSNEAAA